MVRFQEFLILSLKTIKLSIKIHLRFLSTIFIQFDPVGTRYFSFSIEIGNGAIELFSLDTEDYFIGASNQENDIHGV